MRKRGLILEVNPCCFVVPDKSSIGDTEFVFGKGEVRRRGDDAR